MKLDHSDTGGFWYFPRGNEKFSVKFNETELICEKMKKKTEKKRNCKNSKEILVKNI